MRRQDQGACPQPVRPSQLRFDSLAKAIADLAGIAAGVGLFLFGAGSDSLFAEGQIPDLEERSATVTRFIEESKEFGRSDKGQHVFAHAKAACASCHRIGEAGGIIGPELLAVIKDRSASQIAESLLWPDLEVVPKYKSYQFLLEDDSVVTGYLETEESEQNSDSPLRVRNPATGLVSEIDRDQIIDQKVGSSLMPSGLLESLPQQQRWDLMQFLISLSNITPERLAQVEHSIRSASHHGVLTFEYDSKPLNPATRPLHHEFVNRDRVYDFYSKQANAFRNVDTGLEHLESIKSLDNGKYGHWGNQDEETWKGADWSKMQFHKVHATVFAHGSLVVPRGVCLKLGPNDRYSACYDPENGQIVALWEGGFIQFSSIRHGLLDSARIVGEMLPITADLSGRNPLIAKALVESGHGKPRYLGYREFDGRVEFVYQVGEQIFVDAFATNTTGFERSGAILQSINDNFLVSKNVNDSKKNDGKTKRWPEQVTTKVQLGSGDGYVIDTISLPEQNPWDAPMFCSAHGFLEDGTAIVTTIHGDVFRVENITFDPKNPLPQNANWRRIASGLHHPLGVWIDQDGIFIQCRNQLTRLHDLDGDFEIDYYECVSDAFVTSPGGHDYICGLVRDSEGNFYTASGNQGVVKISPDGKEATVIATGFRNPDGLGVLPGDILTVPTSEGDWTPGSMVHYVPTKQTSAPLIDSQQSAGENSSEFPLHFGYGGPREGKPVQRPFLCLPRYIDNSSGGQIWVTDPRMGPLQNQIVHTSFGTGTAILVLKDEVNGVAQGAAVVLPGDFQSGIHRAATNPADGQLYFTGMAGWGTYTPKLGCFERMRYTGAPVCLPVSFKVRTNGVELRFSQPLSAEISNDAKSQFAQMWNYRYAPAYGSPEYSVFDSGIVGHDRLVVESVVIDDDGKGMFLEIPDLQKCNQLHLNLLVGTRDPIELFITVNEMAEPRRDVASYKLQDRKVFLPHPLDRDLVRLTNQKPNPCLVPREGAREIRVDAADNLQFAQKQLQAKSGEWVTLVFSNPDVVPHNWALFRPGSLDRVGLAVNKLIADPEAYVHQYVPQTQDLVCYTDIVAPKSEFRITFQVPQETGRYPYLCTFPGHWMVMNGEMVVVD